MSKIEELFNVFDRPIVRDDINDLLAIIRKMENPQWYYIGKKDQQTISRIEEQYREPYTFNGLSTAEKDILERKVQKIIKGVNYE